MQKNSVLVACDSYTPNHMLDMLMTRLGTKNDAALARALAVPPSTISKVRNRQMVVNSTLLLAAHETTEFSIRELRDMLGDTGTRYWLGGLGDRAGENKMPAFVDRMPSYRKVESIAHA
jgi:hypothetical protein